MSDAYGANRRESASGRAAIVGLGLTDVGKVYGRTAPDFAAEAVLLAADDAGVHVDDIDGMLVSAGIARPTVGLTLARELGLRDVRLLMELNCYGASAGAMVAQAAMAVASGAADMVACVWADAPLQEGDGSGAAYGVPRTDSAESGTSMESLPVAAGLVGATPYYALAARRHMAAYGTTSGRSPSPITRPHA